MEEVINESWKGQIPVKFTLCQDDLSTTKSPKNIFKLCSRMSYLHACAETAIEYYRCFTMDVKCEIWFEYDGIPLKSHLPIGVLYDFHNLARCVKHTYTPTKAMTTPANDTTFEMHPNMSNLYLRNPWNITIHFQRFPFDQLLKCDSLELTHDHYLHAVKQSLHLIHGHTRAFTSLSLESQQALWCSTCKGNFTLHMSALASLVPASVTSYPDLRFLPIRVIHYTRNKPNLTITQRPVPSNQLITLSQVVTGMLGPYVQVSRNQFSNKESTTALTLGSSANALSELEINALPAITDMAPIHVARPTPPQSLLERPDKLYLIQGVEVPSTAPIFELWCALRHPDLFLYVTVVEIDADGV